jgi:AhpC/TSA family
VTKSRPTAKHRPAPKGRPASRTPAGTSGNKPGNKPGNKWVFPAVVAAVIVVGIIAVVIVVAGGGGGNEPPKGGPAKVEVASDVTVGGVQLPQYTGTSRDAALGLAAPTLDSVDFQDRPVQAGGATGSPYALVFLSHWCPHCQNEVPRLVDSGEGGQIAGVDVTGVLTGSTKEAPNYPPSAWLAREGWKYGVLLDDDRGTAARAFGLASVPYFVFVDASGNVAGRISGEIAEDQLREIFEALAAGESLPLPSSGASSSAR